MISTLEKEITLRFLKARKNDGFLNVISIFSFIGISLGVAVLIVVMSVMNGFRTELINKIVGFNSHITVKSYDNSINLDKLNNNNLKLISKQIILSNSGEAIVLKNNTSKGIILRGYLGNDFSKLEIIKNKNFKGNRSKLNKNSISIGNELSFSLNLKIGDDVTLMSPSGVETIIGSMPKQKTFTVTSIFNSGLADFDNNIALINLDTLVDFFGGKMEAKDFSNANGAALEQAGAAVGIHTDDYVTDSRLFLRSAAFAVREGMSRDKALEALTLANAKMMRIDNRIGSLKKGKDADLVILSGDPFSVYTHVEQTWIEGQKIWDRSNPEDKKIATGGYGVFRLNTHTHTHEGGQ